MLAPNMVPLIRQNIINRKANYADVDIVLKHYERFRTLQHELEQLRKKRNQHATLAKQLVLLENDYEREKMMDQHAKVGKDYKKQVQEREHEIEEIEHTLVQEALKLPNRTHVDSPVGDEDQNRVVFETGNRLMGEGRLNHIDIANKFDLLDFANASKLTGSKFVFMKNEAAMLELGLVNWALQFVCKKGGFTAVTTPDLARQQVVEACGFQPRDPSSQVYHLQAEGPNQPQDCLIGTSEIPLAGMYANELLQRSHLPAKFAAFSHCFRKEAGSGKESRGLYRLHQFSKVEMFASTTPETSDEVLMEFVEIQKEILNQLELPYRVLNMATEELGAAAYRKFDIEAWMPSRQMYGEVSSASNCTSYQSRRLNINFVGDHNTKTLVHTVNGTALAVPRIVLCLLETGWDEKTQTVSIPKCLHNFLPFDRIEKHRSSISLQ